MALREGDAVSRIGDQDVEGVVIRVAVDLGNGGPGNVVEVQAGDKVHKVLDEVCQRGKAWPPSEVDIAADLEELAEKAKNVTPSGNWDAPGNPKQDVENMITFAKTGVYPHSKLAELDRPIESIGHDGDTMPSGDIDHVTPSLN